MASRGTALRGQAEAYIAIGQAEKALPLLAESRALFDGLRASYPDQTRYLRDAALADMTYATTALDRGELDVGKEHLLAARELLEQVGPEDSIALRVRELKGLVSTNLGLTERRLGNTQAAKEAYDRAIVENRRLIELEPAVPRHQWNLVVAVLNSGGPELDLGNLEPLVERWRSVLPVLEQLIAAEPENQRYRQVKAMLQSNIAIILRDLGKHLEAIEPLIRATEILLEQSERLDHAPEAYLPVALNHYELATTYQALERYQQALAALDDSDRVISDLLQRHAGFTPARGHQLDAQLLRFVVLSELPSTPHESLQALANENVSLARELHQEQPEVADYRRELPVALQHRSKAAHRSGDFEAAVRDVREATEQFQLLVDEDDTESNRAKLVAAALYWAGMLLDHHQPGRDFDHLAPETSDNIQELLALAEEHGATPEELIPLRTRFDQLQ